jgi:hypothetical protein
VNGKLVYRRDTRDEAPPGEAGRSKPGGPASGQD